MHERAYAGLVAGTAVALAALSGCGGTPSRQVAAPATTTPAGCPTAATAAHLPSDVPASLPAPAVQTVLSDTTSGNGLHVVRFATGLSLREGVQFILARYPAAGFVLGRGDAEPTEADAPFSTQDGTLRGALRLTTSAPCATTWLLAFAVAANGSGPPIPSYSPTTSASALPFG